MSPHPFPHPLRRIPRAPALLPLALLLPLLLAACATPVPSPNRPSSAAWAPVASTLREPDGAVRRLAAGPFSETAAAPDASTLRAPLRPFYASSSSPLGGRTDWDALWPLAQGKTLGTDLSWRVLLAFRHIDDLSDPASPRRFWLLPFWFSGRAADGAPYRALFPFGGTIGDFILKDRIAFVLFPLWARSRVDDVTTTDILFPLVSRTTTPDGRIDKFRVLPFYSRSSFSNHYAKTHVLWPIWSHARYAYPNSSGTAWVLFPLVGRTSLTDQRGWMVLPPFFQHAAGPSATRTYAPWPFFQRETGPRDKLYLWPFWGRRADGPLRRTFVLWPFFTAEHDAWGLERTVRRSFFPFWHRRADYRALDPAAPRVRPSRRPSPDAPRPASSPSAVPADPTPPALVASSTRLWPLFTHTRTTALPGRPGDPDRVPAVRFRAPSLWPFPEAAPVERSWAPFWTLLDYRSAGPASSLSLFWGLYRSETTPAATTRHLFPLWDSASTAPDTPDDASPTTHWSLLKGLLSYTHTPDARTLRLLWLLPVPLPAP